MLRTYTSKPEFFDHLNQSNNIKLSKKSSDKTFKIETCCDCKSPVDKIPDIIADELKEDLKKKSKKSKKKIVRRN